MGEGPEYIRSGHRDPDEFEPDSLRTIPLSEEEGIKAIIGKPKDKDTTQIQSHLFVKDKWTLEKAKATLKVEKVVTKTEQPYSELLPVKSNYLPCSMSLPAHLVKNINHSFC